MAMGMSPSSLIAQRFSNALMQALHARGLETEAADLDFQGFDRGSGQGGYDSGECWSGR